MARFEVRAVWDEEAGVFFSETDIPGLVVEAPTFADFEALARELAREVLGENLGLHAAAVEVVNGGEIVAPAV